MKKTLTTLFALLISVFAFASGHTATTTQTNISCNGACNGTATGSATGGIGPYGYSWAGPSSYSASGTNITSLCVGTYTLTVIDSSDMSTATTTAIITEPAPMATIVNSPTICVGISAVLNSTTTGGTPGYTYSWTPSGSLTSSTISNPLASPVTTTTYTVTVTDTHGCISSATSTVVVNPLPVVTVNSTTICAGQTAVLVASGGMTYAWNTGAISNPLNVTPATTTTYTVTGTSLGCTGSASGTVTVNPAASAIVPANISVCNGITIPVGVISTIPAGGTVAWTNSNTAIGLAASGVGNTPSFIATNTGGTIITSTITVTATYGGCSGVPSSYTITVYPTPISTLSPSPAMCGLCNGSVTNATSGGTPPYTYLWVPGSITTSSVTSMCAGSYTIQVTDANGCSGYAVTTITNTPTITSVNLTSVPTGCGASSGSVTIGTVIGGTPPYTYSFNGGPFTATTFYSGLSAGAYNVTVEESTGCTYSTVAVVANSSGATSASITTVNSGCVASTGEINIGSVTGGTPPYTYSVNGGSYSSITNFTGLSAGAYTIIVKDAVGCMLTQFATISTTTAHPAITLNYLQNISCTGGIPGSINITTSGGTPGYTYLWSPSSVTTEDLSGVVSPGVYSLTVTDSLGCSASQTFYVGTASSLYGTISIVNGNCGTMGTATTIGGGGTSPYSYSWNTIPVQTTATATGLASGYYSCVITDSVGCSKTVSAAINNTCRNIIKGNVYNDLNSNCLKDAGEAGFVGKVVIANGPLGTYFATTDINGNYTLLTPNMTNTVSISYYALPSYYSPTCPATGSLSVNFSVLGDTILNNNFGFFNNPSFFDLGIHPGWSGSNPGFNKHYWIFPYNNSPTSQNALIRFVYDSNLVYISSTLGGVHFPAQHKIEWTFSALPPSGGVLMSAYKPDISFYIPTTLSITSNLTSYFEILPIIGDSNPYDNTLSSVEPVTGCRDPNSKLVIPQGTGPYGDIFQSDSVLTYTIHFQNNGNDTAHFVVVTDTLSQFLDPATVVPGAANHPYTFDLSGEGIMNFRFDNIMLPDSTTDEPASNGYFTYTVKVKAGTPIGSIINNTANIYFDFNEAVVTNTTVNRIIDYTTGIETTSTNNVVKVYPNPFTDNTTFVIQSDKLNEMYSFELTDVLGKKVKSMNGISDKQFQISRNDLQNGIYFYKIYNAESIVGIGKLIIK